MVRGESELVAVETLDDHGRDALRRYLQRLERRTGTRWHVLRLVARTTAPRRWYSVMLLGEAGKHLVAEYGESPRGRSARWVKRR